VGMGDEGGGILKRWLILVNWGGRGNVIGGEFL